MLITNVSAIENMEEYKNHKPALDNQEIRESVVEVVTMDDIYDVSYTNVTTGVTGKTVEEAVRNPRHICVKFVRADMFGYYFQILSSDLMAVEFYRIMSGSSKKDIPTDWQYQCSAYMAKDGNVYIRQEDMEKLETSDGKGLFGGSGNPDLIDLKQYRPAGNKTNGVISGTVYSDSQRTLRKFLGTALTAANNAITLYTGVKESNLLTMLNTQMPDAKLTKRMEELLSLPLTDEWKTKDSLNRIVPLFPDLSVYDELEVSVSVVQKVSDGIGVMRFFVVTPDAKDMDDQEYKRLFEMRLVGPDHYTFDEYARVYSDGDKVYAVKNVMGKWVKASNSVLSDLNTSCIYWDKEEVKGTKFAYLGVVRERIDTLWETIMDIITRRKKHPEATLPSAIANIKNLNCLALNALTSPVVEQILKSKYTNVVRLFILRSLMLDCRKETENMFGLKAKAKVSFSDTVMSDAVLQAFDKALEGAEFEEVETLAIDHLKGRLFAVYFSMCVYCEIAEIDSEYFKNIDPDHAGRIVNALVAIMKPFNNSFKNDALACFRMSIIRLVEMLGIHNCVRFFEGIRDYVLQCDNGYGYGAIIMREYWDYIRMLHTVVTAENAPRVEIAWKFADKGKFVSSMHYIEEIYSVVFDELIATKYANAFAERQESWKELEYANGEFLVKVPETAGEILQEGASLHHCVKSYVESVAEGQTTILFIRKVSEPDVPYYTLEVKDGRVRQCHGLQNCNATEEVEKFLKEYCKEKKITFTSGRSVLAVGA